MIERIFHFNINCTDIERAVGFYQLFGFKIILDFRDGMASKEMAEAFGMPTANLKGVHLRIGARIQAVAVIADARRVQVRDLSGQVINL